MEEHKEPQFSDDFMNSVSSEDMYTGDPLDHRARPGLDGWPQYDEYVQHLGNSSQLFRYFMSFEHADSEKLTNRYCHFKSSKFLDAQADDPDADLKRDLEAFKMELMDQVPIVEREDFQIEYSRSTILQSMFHQEKFRVLRRPGVIPDEVGHCSVWLDAQDCFAHCTGILFYEKIKDLSERTAVKAEKIRDDNRDELEEIDEESERESRSSYSSKTLPHRMSIYSGKDFINPEPMKMKKNNSDSFSSGPSSRQSLRRSAANDVILFPKVILIISKIPCFDLMEKALISVRKCKDEILIPIEHYINQLIFKIPEPDVERRTEFQLEKDSEYLSVTK